MHLLQIEFLTGGGDYFWFILLRFELVDFLVAFLKVWVTFLRSSSLRPYLMGNGFQIKVMPTVISKI